MSPFSTREVHENGVHGKLIKPSRKSGRGTLLYFLVYLEKRNERCFNEI